MTSCSGFGAFFSQVYHLITIASFIFSQLLRILVIKRSKWNRRIKKKHFYSRNKHKVIHKPYFKTTPFNLLEGFLRSSQVLPLMLLEMREVKID